MIGSVRGAQPRSLECELQTRAGPRGLFIDARPAWDPVPGQRALQLNAHDIGELKATQEALEAATRAAQAANKAKSAFLANRSHEIRTPFNGVLGVIQLVQRTTLTQEQRSWIEIARESGQLLLTLLNDLLDLSKIEADRMEIEGSAFDLRDMLSNATVAIGILASAKGQRQGPALALRGERVRARGCARRCGQRAQQVAHAFAPCSQGAPSVTRRLGGTGLGLSIVDRLARLADQPPTRCGRGAERIAADWPTAPVSLTL